MADKIMQPGLPDPKNFNFYGAEPSDTQAYQDALQASVQALEQRYANPNWFNVAAGFFKPQLGGFGASLGSASQALGENLEKQRESQLPLAQMRAQLAASKIAMGQGSAAAKAFDAWKATGKPMDEATYAHITGLAPNSAVATAAKAAYEGERTNQTLKVSQQQLLQTQITAARESIVARRNLGVISVEQAQRELKALDDRMKAESPAVVPTGPTDTSIAPRQADKAVPKPSVLTDTGSVVGNPIPPPNISSTSLAPAGSAAAAPPAAPPAAAAAPAPAAPPAAPAPAASPAAPAPAATRPPAAPPAAAAPAAPAAPAAASEQITIIDSPLGSKSQLQEATRVAEAAEREKEANKRLTALGNAGGTSETYEPASRIIEDQTRLIKDNPVIAKKVMSLMAQGTFRSQIEAMLQQGVGINFSGLSGNINIPVAIAKRAGLNDTERGIYDALASNFAALAVMKQRAGGLSPNSGRNIEYTLYNDLTPSMNTTPAAAVKALAHLRNELDATNAQYKFVRSVYDDKHPTIKIGPMVPNRLDAVFGHQSFSDVYAPYAAKNKQVQEAYQAYLDRNAPAKKPANKKP